MVSFISKKKKNDPEVIFKNEGCQPRACSYLGTHHAIWGLKQIFLYVVAISCGSEKCEEMVRLHHTDASLAEYWKP